MKIRLLITLCCVLYLSDGLLAEEENEIKRGIYPYMAFIYYPDETVVDATGSRYLRGAVLLKPDWLISSTVEPTMINDVVQGFPRKTLMARVGATSIDANITLNEDEDEQEREVIQIVRPYNHSATQWWRDDISLLKTLLPFNLTSAVSVAPIRSKPGANNGNCFILVFAKRSNVSDDRLLTQLFVELQPPSLNNCGQHFFGETMLCAVDSDENKNTVNDAEFCQGNSGGPLVCENEVTGIQTYVDNNCKPPHLYQLLSAWDNFITCGIEEKCNEEGCAHMCMLLNKDFTDEERAPVKVEHVSAETKSTTEEITIPMHYSTSTEVPPDEEDILTTIPTPTTLSEKLTTVEATTASTTVVTTVITTESTTTTEASSLRSNVETAERSWPKKKYPERMKSFEEDENKIERKTNVEAQQQNEKVKKDTSAGRRNMCVIESLVTLCVLVSLI